MAVRETLQIGDARLKAANAVVSDFQDHEVLRVIQDLHDTMEKAGLIGMAAPQIGENVCIFVTEPRVTQSRTGAGDEFRVYINPQVVWKSDEQSEIFEGCGSVLQGQLFGPVLRPRDITIEAFDATGKSFRLSADGILARVIQHEYDHLEGIEFLEKVSDYRQIMTWEHYAEKIKPNPKYQKASEITKIKIEYVNS